MLGLRVRKQARDLGFLSTFGWKIDVLEPDAVRMNHGEYNLNCSSKDDYKKISEKICCSHHERCLNYIKILVSKIQIVK